MSYPPVGDEKSGYPPQEQQPGYPPQQGYPPPQQGYPPQQQEQPAYPPQGYPPQQQQGYPPQQPGYPPQQQGYPPQQDYKTDAPPPYYGGQQAAPQQQPVAAQQTSTNVVVVNSQPTVTPYYTRVIRPAGDNYLTLSIVLTVVCCLCGTWYSLCCTIPAIFLAIQARDAEARGDVAGARSKGYFALGCNIAACVWWVVALIIWIGLIVGANANSSSCSYYYSYTYNRYTSYC